MIKNWTNKLQILPINKRKILNKLMRLNNNRKEFSKKKL